MHHFGEDCYGFMAIITIFKSTKPNKQMLMLHEPKHTIKKYVDQTLPSKH